MAKRTSKSDLVLQEARGRISQAQDDVDGALAVVDSARTQLQLATDRARGPQRGVRST